ncbi:MAG: hypothetical protein AAF363_16955 [Bacteroidota bacterium]
MEAKKEYISISEKVARAERSGNLAPEWNPDTAWQRLEAQLMPVEEKKTVIAWYWKAAAIVFLMGLTFIFLREVYFYRPYEKIVINQNENKTYSSELAQVAKDEENISLDVAVVENSEKLPREVLHDNENLERIVSNERLASNSQESKTNDEGYQKLSFTNEIDLLKATSFKSKSISLNGKPLTTIKEDFTLEPVPVASSIKEEIVIDKKEVVEKRPTKGIKFKFFTRSESNNKTRNERPPLVGFASIKN